MTVRLSHLYVTAWFLYLLNKLLTSLDFVTSICYFAPFLYAAATLGWKSPKEGSFIAVEGCLLSNAI
uniref:Uncharacterized protein n=1 Tax=Rhizophora mucronata TaxID=61149 RepID=A0A2P2N9G3_RHIMU